MAQKPKKERSLRDITRKAETLPLPSARRPLPRVAYEPPVKRDPLGNLIYRGPQERPEPEEEVLLAPPPPLEPVTTHMTAEQQAEHDRIVKEAQETEAERRRGYFQKVLDPITPSPDAPKRPLFGYYSPGPRVMVEPTFEETLEPLKMFDILGRGIRTLVTGLPETQLAAPGEPSSMIANIATDMLTDPLFALGLAKGAVSGLRGIRGMLDDVVSAGLAGQDPGVAQIFGRVRPEQLDELAAELQQGLLESGFKRLSPQFQRALTRYYADQRGAIHPAYEGMFPTDPTSNMFSQMGRALERKLPNRGSPKEMWELVRKFQQKGDFKKAELEWSGLDDWLASRRYDDPKKPLTREAILDYVRGNELEVKVVTRRGTETSQTYGSYVEGDPANWNDYQEILITLPSREARFSQHFQDDTIAWFRTVERKFKDPVTGEERRILHIEELQSDWHQKGRQLGYAEDVDLAARSDEYDELQELLEEAQDNVEVLENDYGLTADDAYYELEAAKERYNDLEYELEELQGEWNDLDMEADEIRSELELDLERFEADKQMELPGTPPHEPPSVEIPEEMQDRLDDLQERIDDMTHDLRAQEDIRSDAESAHDTLQEAQDQLENARHDFDQLDERPVSDKPPPAPFGKTWTELGFKRMLQKAVDDGYDTISWSRGQTQADRYNAAFYVEDIKYSKRRGMGRKGVEEDQVVLTFRKKQDVEAGHDDIWHEKVAPEALLEDWVGKKISKKIRDGGETGHLENEELWLGGEELKFFYDGEMKNIAQKLVKKYGGKVTTESMGPTFQVAEVPASAGDFTSWANTEIPRLRLAKEALQEQIVKLKTLSPAENYRPELANRMGALSRQADALANRESMLYAARSRIEHGTEIEKIDPTVLSHYMRANPQVKKQWQIVDPTNRTRTGKMVFDTYEEALEASAPMVNTIRINPKMREAIVERGWPLYQILLGTTGAAAGAEAMPAREEGQ